MAPGIAAAEGICWFASTQAPKVRKIMIARKDRHP
jgi:hypothetical protein